MILGTILALAYLAVALSAAMMTLWEQKRQKARPILRVAGFALCMIWPLTVIAMLVAIQLRRLTGRADEAKNMAHGDTVKVN